MKVHQSCSTNESKEIKSATVAHKVLLIIQHYYRVLMTYFLDSEWLMIQHYYRVLMTYARTEYLKDLTSG